MVEDTASGTKEPRRAHILNWAEMVNDGQYETGEA